MGSQQSKVRHVNLDIAIDKVQRRCGRGCYVLGGYYKYMINFNVRSISDVDHEIEESTHGAFAIREI